MGEGYGGIDVRVIAVDFVAMLAQQFAVDDAGTRLTPLEEPVGCAGPAADRRAPARARRRHR
jgi:hypothetical protein